MNKKRLLNAARAVEEHPVPREFTMGRFKHDCGTPACVLGCYAVRHDLQRTFKPALGYTMSMRLFRDEYRIIGCDSDEVLKHFDIYAEEAMELFGSTGCGGAKTPQEAAAYIRAFVARKEAIRSYGGFRE